MLLNINSMRVLIFGGNGWIGQQFVSVLNASNASNESNESNASNQSLEYRIAATRVDLDHIADLEQEMDAFAPTHVISFLGRTHGEKFTTIDYLEQPGKLVENVRDNLIAASITRIWEPGSFSMTRILTLKHSKKRTRPIFSGPVIPLSKGSRTGSWRGDTAKKGDNQAHNQANPF